MANEEQLKAFSGQEYKEYDHSIAFQDFQDDEQHFTKITLKTSYRLNTTTPSAPTSAVVVTRVRGCHSHETILLLQ